MIAAYFKAWSMSNSAASRSLYHSYFLHDSTNGPDAHLQQATDGDARAGVLSELVNDVIEHDGYRIIQHRLAKDKRIQV